MELETLGIMGMAAITVICVTAAAVGVVSGLAATGIDQVKKQLTKDGDT